MTHDGAWKSGNKAGSSAHGLASKAAIGLILLFVVLTPTYAQTDTGSTATPQAGGGMMGGGMMGSGRGGRHRNQQQNTQQAPALAPLPVVKEPWPRLDAGAILCKTRDDLARYQMRGVGGSETTGPAPDCHLIRKLTPIQILDRDGPSHTHVVTTDDAKQTGWTNAYLTSEPPPSTATPTPVKH
jgi:hypothetical protein